MTVYRNTRTGRIVERDDPDKLMDRSKRWERIKSIEEPEPEAFDPAEHSVEEVLAYLETAEPDERRRVLDAERTGKGRRGVLRTESGE